ncbi:unnamed protein product [Laminaria digitata]
MNGGHSDVNQPSKRLTNQQSTNQPIMNQPTNRPTDGPTNQSTNQSTTSLERNGRISRTHSPRIPTNTPINLAMSQNIHVRFVPFVKDSLSFMSHTKHVVCAIDLSHLACKDEFRRKPRPHS